MAATAPMGATEVHGSELFRIRRIFSVGSDAATTADDRQQQQPTSLKIAAMAVHTLEKKQLLAMSITEDLDAGTTTATTPAASAPHAHPAHASAAPSIALGHLPSITPRKSRMPPTAGAASAAIAHGLGSRDAERKKHLKQQAALSSASNYLLVRTIEEDERARFWKFPVYSTRKQQAASAREKLVALEFSPEGDWLAGLSSRKNRLHLIPVAALIARQRKRLLDAVGAPRSSATRELMGVEPSVMTTQMASYLRATNAAGGLNGARYHSQVAGDDAQMSVLEFAIGIGAVTCVRWWRSLSSANYVLVGGSEGLISIVNVEENAEVCRCELQRAGAIVSIDLVRENFRHETRTSMLVTACSDDDASDRSNEGRKRYYRVVLEKKVQAPIAKAAAAMRPTVTRAASTGSAEPTNFASASGTPSFTTATATALVHGPSLQLPRPPKYIVKTFPQHFLEDVDFRPQRVKKSAPRVALYAINSLLTTESSLALFDAATHRARLFSNFQWALRHEYVVPSLAPVAAGARTVLPDGAIDANDAETEVSDAVVDVEIAYCTTDLLLLQGRNATTNENVATWVSLPSRNALDDDTDAAAHAHIVHYLTLHNNERIERVVQSTSRQARGAAGGSDTSDARTADAQVIYLLQTAHSVYECRPQWSRLALFQALCTQTIALSNAQSIGYALGIDMASLCQVAADTLCKRIRDNEATSDDRTLQWVRDLFAVSRALPTTAIAQLAAIGGAQYAIAYAQQILSPGASDAAPIETDATPAVVVDAYERKQVALALLDLVLRERLRLNVSTTPGTQEPEKTQRAIDVNDADASAASQRLADTETWLVHFLQTSRDYDTSDVVALCLAHEHVDRAVLVGQSRSDVRFVLQQIVAAGLATFVSADALALLVASGFARDLARPESRLILRSFEVDTQVDVLLAYEPALVAHRDWLLRHLPTISRSRRRRIATCLDPRNQAAASAAIDPSTQSERSTRATAADVASSETMDVRPEERVELFLTVLLSLNRDDEDGSKDANDESAASLYSQAALEQLMKTLAHQYRPPVLVARCVDYGNWTAAASLYEAHGELIEAVEARLHAHSVLRPVAPTSSSTLHRRRQSSDASIESVVSDASTSAFQDAMRDELLELLQSLVVQRDWQRHATTTTTEASNAPMRAAILARLLVKWFEYGLARTELEVFLIDPKVYASVAPLLATIFFADVVDSILGTSRSDVAVPLASASASASTGTATTTTRHCASIRTTGLDDRDRDWVRRCHTLPFSGQFFFHVCATFLDSSGDDTSIDGLERLQTNDSAATGPTATSESLLVADRRRSATQRLLDLVKDNVIKNDVAHRVVMITPHSAQALGKSDPLETHAKVFTCGHVFPKRVFDEDIVPEFEKRMTTLPVPLLTTKHVLLREFKRSAVEAPCPICSFNKVSALVQHQRDSLAGSNSSGQSPATIAAATHTAAPPAVEFYFLHAADKHNPQSYRQHHSSNSTNGGSARRTSHHHHHTHHQQQQQWCHEPWEWRAMP